MLTLEQIIKVSRMMEQTPKPAHSDVRYRRRIYRTKRKDSVRISLNYKEDPETGSVYLVSTYL